MIRVEVKVPRRRPGEKSRICIVGEDGAVISIWPEEADTLCARIQNAAERAGYGYERVVGEKE